MFKETLRIAFGAIRSNLFRSLITVFIIAIGIMALVGIVTSLEGVQTSLAQSFSSAGTNTVSIIDKSFNFSFKGKKKTKAHPSIKYEDAELFKRQFTELAVVSISKNGPFSAILKQGSKQTDPNVNIIGVDENYLMVSDFNLEYGRNFTPNEVKNGATVIILTQAIVKSLFNNNGKSALSKTVSLNGAKYLVIGILKEKASGFGFNNNRQALIPVNTLIQRLQHYTTAITIKVSDIAEINYIKGFSEGLFRKIRGLKPTEESDFELTDNTQFMDSFMKNTNYIKFGGLAIAIVTLLGSAIALMNIMLVSVTERTREIGVRKSIGATSTQIKNQFLIEAILICIMGGILGIILGVSMGNAVSYFLGSGLSVPYMWILIALVMCVLVGVISGYYPAVKASKLDPIEALRYE